METPGATLYSRRICEVRGAGKVSRRRRNHNPHPLQNLAEEKTRVETGLAPSQTVQESWLAPLAGRRDSPAINSNCDPEDPMAGHCSPQQSHWFFLETRPPSRSRS